MNASSAHPGNRILIIDDNASIHEDFRRILGQEQDRNAELTLTRELVFGESSAPLPHAGFVIDSAFQGQEGLALAKRAAEEGNPYALAFVDVRMPPGWDGVETIGHLWQYCPEIQIVVCSAYSDYSWEDMIRQLGHSPNLVVLQKPFDNIEALQLAHALTEKWRLNRKMQSQLDDLETLVRRRTSELEAANVRLRRSHEEFKDLFDNAPVGFHEVDTEGRLVRINNTELKMLGCSAEELLGQFVWKISAEEEISHRAALAKLGGEPPPPQAFGRTFRRKDGSTFPVLINDRILRGKDGAIVGIRAAIQDDTERKKAEAALQENQRQLAETNQMLQMVMDTIPVRLFWKNKDLVYMGCNQLFAEDAGRKSSEEIVGETDYNLGWLEQAEPYRKDDMEVMRSGNSKLGYEEPQTAPNGKQIWVRTSKIPLRDINNRIIGILGTYEDITERKRAEEILRINQERLLKVITQTRCILSAGQVEGLEGWRERALHPESPFRWDFQVQNEEVAQKILPLELAPGEQYQQAWARSRNHDDHTQMNWNSGNAFLNDLPFYRNEFRCTDKNGVGHWMQQLVTVRKLAENRWEIFGITMDISDLKRVETELRESQALYHSLVDQMPAGVFRKDARGRYVFVNSAFCRFRDMTSDQYLGKTPLKLGVPDVELTTKGASHHAMIMQSGNPIEDDEVYTRPDGQTRNYHAVKTPVFNSAGKIVGTQGILLDITERKQAEETIARERQLLRTLIDLLPEIFYIKDLDGRFLVANEALAKHFGKETAAQILGLSDADFYPAELAAEFRAQEMKVFAGEPLIDNEGKDVSPGGREGTFLTTKVPFRDSQGRIQGLVGIGRDITERKRAEEALHHEQALMATLMENIPDSVYIKDTASRFLRVNRAHARRFGLSDPAQIVGKSDADFFSKEHAQQALADEQEIIRTGQPLLNVEEKETWFDGTVNWVLTSKLPVRDATGRIIGTCGISRDITERKRAEEALRWSETQLHVILESTADGILAVDSKGKVIAANQRFAELWRIPQSLMDAEDERALLDLVLEQLSDPDAFLKKEQSLYNTDAMAMDTLVFKDGRIFERYYFPMIMDGALIGRVWSFRDITGRKRQEKELSEKNSELERFTYTVSHDLKSPLVTVKTFLGYLEQDLARPDKERVKQDVAYMHTAADKMGQLLDELLNLARVGRKSNPDERITFKELAQEAVRLVAGRISTGGAEVQVADAAVVLEGDRPRLIEIWQNLVENACKFMGNQPKPRVEIGVEKRGSETVFFVRDNGAGIDPRFQEKVFGLFEKLDPKGEGTGMGLALVKRIVEMYKGRIWVESSGLGQGANFLFTLPEAVIIDPEQSS